MKFNINLQSILLVLALAGCVFLFIRWNQANKAAKEANKINDTLVLKEKEMNDKAIKHNDSVNVKSAKVIDSLNGIISSAETRRKNEYYKYEKELTKLKGIKTYTQRVSYLDSIDAFLSH